MGRGFAGAFFDRGVFFGALTDDRTLWTYPTSSLTPAALPCETSFLGDGRSEVAGPSTDLRPVHWQQSRRIRSDGATLL
jgi:hypothetical protein